MTEAAQTPPSLIGEKIGNYSIVSVLGQGGMGVVYLAEHPQIGKRVAIKVLHADYAARSDAAARCFLEARAVNEIGHPSVVDIIDCGVAELPQGAVHYLLMELLEGESLRALLRRGPLPVDRATSIAAEVGRALAAAHDKGIIHRDIKPENIYLARTGDGERVKVLDFGIAKLLDHGVFGDRLTQSGVTLGTPQYMAPEQLDNEDIDGRVDVYALGIVLFEMITGAAPFADEPTARGVWRRMNELPPLTDEDRAKLPPGLEELLMRAMDPDRIRRPEMADLVRGLVDPSSELPAVGGDPHTRRLAKLATPPPSRPSADAVTSRPPSDHDVEPQPPRRRWWLGLIALAGLAAIAFAIVAATRGGGERTADPAPQSTPSGVVTVKITTTPSGAEVYVGTEPAPRGVTPLDVRLPKSTGAVPVRIALDGYAELKRSLDTLENGAIDEKLTRTRPEPPVGKPPVRPPVRPLPPVRPPVIVKPPADAGVTPDAAAVAPPDAAPRTPSDAGLGTNLIQPGKK